MKRVVLGRERRKNLVWGSSANRSGGPFEVCCFCAVNSLRTCVISECKASLDFFLPENAKYLIAAARCLTAVLERLFKQPKKEKPEPLVATSVKTQWKQPMTWDYSVNSLWFQICRASLLQANTKKCAKRVYVSQVPHHFSSVTWERRANTCQSLIMLVFPGESSFASSWPPCLSELNCLITVIIWPGSRNLAQCFEGVLWKSELAGVSGGWSKMPGEWSTGCSLTHTCTRLPTCIYSISTCMYLDSLRLQDISLLPHEKAPCQRLGTFRGRSRGLCDLFMTPQVLCIPGLSAPL